MLCQPMMAIAPWLYAVNSLLTVVCSIPTGWLIGDPLEAQTVVARRCYRPGVVVSGSALGGGRAFGERRCPYQGREIV